MKKLALYKIINTKYPYVALVTNKGGVVKIPTLISMPLP